MGKLHYMQWCPADYKADTSHLTLEEDGAYRRLLDELWLAEGRLAFDRERLARRLRVSTRKWDRLWSVIGEFFIIENGDLTHKRISADIKLTLEKIEKRSQAGAKGARGKWKKYKKNKDGSLANAEQSQCDRNGKSEPEGSDRTPYKGSIMNLPPEAALAMKRLRASARSGDETAELDRLERCVDGFADGCLVVSRFAYDKWSDMVARLNSGVGLFCPEKPKSTPPGMRRPKLIAIEGGAASEPGDPEPGRKAGKQ